MRQASTPYLRIGVSIEAGNGVEGGGVCHMLVTYGRGGILSSALGGGGDGMGRTGGGAICGVCPKI